MNREQAWNVLNELLFVGKVEFDSANGTLIVYGKKQTFKHKSNFTDATVIISEFLEKYKEYFRYSYENIPVSLSEIAVGKIYRVSGETVDCSVINKEMIYKGRLGTNKYLFEGDKEYVFDNGFVVYNRL